MNAKTTSKNYSSKPFIVHLAPAAHFMNYFVRMLKENFDYKQHYFVLMADKDLPSEWEGVAHHKVSWKQTFCQKIKSILSTIRVFLKADLILLHSFDIKFAFLLCPFPFILKKSIWLVWGGDNDDYFLEKSTLKMKILCTLKKQQIKHIPYVAACNPDYAIIQNKYHISPKNLHVNNGYTYSNDNHVQLHRERKHDGTLNVIIGSDAIFTNRHIQVLDILKKFSTENIHIYIPLPHNKSSLDLDEYISSVEESARKLFPGKVTIFSEMIERNKYNEILQSMDVGIYNSSIQQGVGTIITMFKSGAKIYMDPNTPLYQIFSNLGLSIHPVESISGELFSEFCLYTDDERENNMKMAEYQFGTEMQVKQWGDIFALASDFQKTP